MNINIPPNHNGTATLILTIPLPRGITTLTETLHTEIINTLTEPLNNIGLVKPKIHTIIPPTPQTRQDKIQHILQEQTRILNGLTDQQLDNNYNQTNTTP